MDDSENALIIVDHLRRLPLPVTCTIHLVHVSMPSGFATHSGALLSASLREEVTTIIHEEQVKGRELLADAARELRSCGCSVTTELCYGDPSSQLLDAVSGNAEKQEAPADLLIVGARGQNMSDHYLLGSVSSRVIEVAECSVLVDKR